MSDPVTRSAASRETATRETLRDGGQMHPYPMGAINQAIEALELSYSYLREKPVIAERIDTALHYLRRANELYEEGSP